MIFSSSWRSLAAYRVRAALALKNIPHLVQAIDMLGGEHLQPAFRAVNPQAVLPALKLDGGQVLFQSTAILEYLDEVAPEPALLPSDAAGRARVRGLALIHAAGTHPLLVPKVRQHLTRLASHLLAFMFFKLDASAYPMAVAINQRLQARPAFAASHPLQQPGAPR